MRLFRPLYYKTEEEEKHFQYLTLLWKTFIRVSIDADNTDGADCGSNADHTLSLSLALSLPLSLSLSSSFSLSLHCLCPYHCCHCLCHWFFSFSLSSHCLFHCLFIVIAIVILFVLALSFCHCVVFCHCLVILNSRSVLSIADLHIRPPCTFNPPYFLTNFIRFTKITRTLLTKQLFWPKILFSVACASRPLYTLWKKTKL